MRRKKWIGLVLAAMLSAGMCAAALGEEEQIPAAAVSAESDSVAALLNELYETSDNPWEKAVYAAGAARIARDGETVAFALRSFDPDLQSLPSYGENEQAWLDAFFENVQAYDLEIMLALEGNALDTSSLETIKNTVARAARVSQAAFDDKAVRVALVDLMLPSPTDGYTSEDGWGDIHPAYTELTGEGAVFEGLDPSTCIPLFYAQSKQRLNVAEGPHALALNCTGADPQALTESARKSAMDRLSRIYKANEMNADEIQAAFDAALAEEAAAVRKGGGEAFTFNLDIDAVAGGDFGAEYTAYMQSFDANSVLWALVDDIWALPDAPAQDFPGNGRINGSQSGTKTIVKAPNDDVGRYVQMRSAETDEMAVDMFIGPGGSVTVYVPRGMYYLLIASGETWYGLEGLFGENGDYSQTDRLEIRSSDYYHTLTLSAGDGDISMYGSSPSAFQ